MCVQKAKFLCDSQSKTRSNNFVCVAGGTVGWLLCVCLVVLFYFLFCSTDVFRYNSYQFFSVFLLFLFLLYGLVWFPFGMFRHSILYLTHLNHSLLKRLKIKMQASESNRYTLLRSTVNRIRIKSILYGRLFLYFIIFVGTQFRFPCFDCKRKHNKMKTNQMIKL